MARIGLICPEMSGHLNPTCALGRELGLRGHDVIFIGLRDGEHHARSAGLEFYPVGEDVFPRGAWKGAHEELGKRQGTAALRYTIDLYRKSAAVFLRDLPAAFRSLQVAGLVVDQTSTPGAAVAERFGLPFVSVACALMMNEEASVPPMITSWTYRNGWVSRWRNQIGNYLFGRAIRAVPAAVNDFRREWNLPPYTSRNSMFSPLAQIAQLPKEFDFPRRELPPHFHYTGPLHTPHSRAEVEFPYERLTGQPLIYASMGTLQNRLGHVFQTIIAACRDLGAQLVVSTGGGQAGKLENLPASAIVVDFAPQLELLKRARLTITHAGMNTVLESLSQGVPLVCVPITNDQPAIAARVAWTRTGEVVPLKKLSVDRLRKAIRQVLTEPLYEQRAGQLQSAIQKAGGLHRAADIVETALSTGQPVI